MGRLKDLIEKLSKVDEQVQTDAVLKIINNHQSQLIDANQQQLLSGRNAKGSVLGIYRSRDYALFKNRLNPTPGLGVWDLHLSGALFEGMYVQADSFPVTIYSTDSKASKFIDADPFGPDEENKKLFCEEIKPDIQEYYKSVFQL